MILQDIQQVIPPYDVPKSNLRVYKNRLWSIPEKASWGEVQAVGESHGGSHEMGRSQSDWTTRQGIIRNEKDCPRDTIVRQQASGRVWGKEYLFPDMNAKDNPFPIWLYFTVEQALGWIIIPIALAAIYTQIK